MKNGFTLIELLVVMAIILILAGILFPAIGRVRQDAKQSRCLTQSREIGVALMLYLGDNDDTYPQEHRSTPDPTQADNLGQLEAIDYGSPFDKILPYVSGTSTSKQDLYVCPEDIDPHGEHLLDANGNCPGTMPLAPPPGALTSFLLNSYYLFGLTSSQVTDISRSIYIAERKDTFCDVHYHPWLGEIELPTGLADKTNPIAIASDRHLGGSNYIYADGHGAWRHFTLTRQPFPGHELYGEHQAF